MKRFSKVLFGSRWVVAILLAIVINSFFFLAIPVLNVLLFRSDMSPKKPQIEELTEVETIVQERKKVPVQKQIRKIVQPNSFRVNARTSSGERSRSNFQMDLSLSRGDGSDGVSVGAGGEAQNVVYEPGDVDEEARALKAVNPIYPERAKKLGIAGYVKVYMVIDVHGNVTGASVLSANPQGYGFESEALKAIRAWKFEPAKLGNYPVAQKATKEFKFVP